MKFAALAALAAPLLITAAAAQAPDREVVPLPSFRSLELNGGGRVILRHGPVHRVTLLNGSTRITDFRVNGSESRRIGRNTFISDPDRLVIDVCKTSCNGVYNLVVEVVTPKIEAIAVNGGGRIETAGRFPRQENMAIAVKGGGQIDARALPAENVGAAVSGGGRILTTAEGSLGAAIKGGGAILYWGDPTVGTSINGGGTVTRGR